MAYYLYILKSRSAEKFYVGSSEHPQTRLTYHNTFEKGFTSRYRPWEIVFMKEYPGKSEAQSAERKVKSWKSSIMLRRLINNELQL
jgi:putative endonuclease